MFHRAESGNGGRSNSLRRRIRRQQLRMLGLEGAQFEHEPVVLGVRNLRIIERGTLRTFGTSVSWVSAAFAGFICIFLHQLWWQLGVFASQATFLKNSDAVKSFMGVKQQDAA